MKSFDELAKNPSMPKYLRDVYGTLAKGASHIAMDSKAVAGAHSVRDIDGIKERLFEEVKAGYVNDGISFQSLDEFKKHMVTDGFVNVMANVNTPMDTGYYNQAYTPVAMGPMEATASYSSGGLPQLIIDKKAKSVLLNGYQFESKHPYWDSPKIMRLKEYADSTGFANKLVDSLRDGFIYGGSVLYPAFKRDDVNSYRQSLRQLIKGKVLTKDAISHWVAIDRWNTVVVPEYNITAQDYLFAKQYYVPIAGVSVATERSAVVRPKELPYWGAIRQLGWGVSDYEGYIKSILAYEIMISSIPIMAQQMSLLMHEIPLDGAIAQNGIEAVRDFMAENDAQLRSWSMNNPKTINAFGKIYAVDRTYTGYDGLGMMLRQDIAAQSGIPESVLFHTQPKGFSNNTEEVLLKQSETIRMSQNSLLPMLQSCIHIMAISCFGPDDELIKNLPYLQLSFETPVVATETERSEASARYAAALSSLVQSGVPAGEAVNLLKQFFREIEISGEFIDAVIQREAENRRIDAESKAAKLQKDNDIPDKKHTDEVINKKNNVIEKARDAK